jgi:hypothetical protein
MKKKWIPFNWLPASWGLRGKSRAIAEAEYYYEGNELEEKLAELNADTAEDGEIAKLAVKLKNEEISQSAYDKKVAGIKGEPYVNVVKMGINPANAQAGFVELDWNDEFVKMLQENGFEGRSDEDIVNKWFNDVCRTILLNEKADLDYGLQSVDRAPTADPDVERRNNSKD